MRNGRKRSGGRRLVGMGAHLQLEPQFPDFGPALVVDRRPSRPALSAASGLGSHSLSPSNRCNASWSPARKASTAAGVIGRRRPRSVGRLVVVIPATRSRWTAARRPDRLEPKSELLEEPADQRPVGAITGASGEPSASRWPPSRPSPLLSDVTLRIGDTSAASHDCINNSKLATVRDDAVGMHRRPQRQAPLRPAAAEAAPPTCAIFVDIRGHLRSPFLG